MDTTEPPEIFRRQLVDLLPRLRRFARNLTRRPEDADDVVQIALERALRHFDQWSSERRLDAWMFRIVRNVWIDELRSRRRRDRLFAAEEAGEDVGEAPLEALTENLSIQAALACLPEEQRSAVMLVLVEGLSYKEAAEVLEVPVGTLTSRLARGREALQSLLQPNREPGP